MGVRGTAGSTPAHANRTSHQREPSAPSAFATPGTARPSSRPSSAMSDVSTASKGKKLSTETLSSAAKVSALGKSTRANNGAGTAATPSTMSRSSSRAVEGSMGPPPAKPRVSSSTPTPMGRASSYSRFPVTKSAATVPSVPQRLSSLEQPQSKPRPSKQGIKASPTLTGSASKQEEKENISIT